MTHDNTEAFCVLDSRLNTFFHLLLQNIKWHLETQKKAKSLENIHDIQSDTKPFFSAVWKIKIKMELQTHTTRCTYKVY